MTHDTLTHLKKTHDQTENINKHPKSAYIIGSIVAVPLSIICYVSVSIIFQFIFYTVYTWVTLLRPEIALFVAIIVGGGMGMQCAKLACEGALKAYSRKAVTCSFFIISTLGILNEIFLQPASWFQLFMYMEFVVPAVYSFALFWNNGE